MLFSFSLFCLKRFQTLLSFHRGSLTYPKGMQTFFVINHIVLVCHVAHHNPPVINNCQQPGTFAQVDKHCGTHHSKKCNLLKLLIFLQWSNICSKSIISRQFIGRGHINHNHTSHLLLMCLFLCFIFDPNIISGHIRDLQLCVLQSVQPINAFSLSSPFSHY